MIKKSFIFALVMFFGFSIFGQELNYQNLNPINFKGGLKLISRAKSISTLENQKDKEIPEGVPIGLTHYDLQSNSAVAKRIVNHGDGKVSAVWTQYQGSDVPAAPQRGTGYNYNDGTGWQYFSETGNVVIEGTAGSPRTGWPTLTIDGSGNEFVFNHFNAGGLYGWKQAVGTSNTAWATNHVSLSEPITWPRTAQSGQTIIVIGCGEDEVAFNMHNPRVIKSTDNGAAFTEITDDIDFANITGFSGDSYAIAARGNVFAFTSFSGMNDFIVWKSIDAGETWNTFTIIDVPGVYNTEGGVLYDNNGDNIADAVCNTDGTGDLIIDSEGQVHVVWSRMNHGDDDPSGDGSSFFPYTDFVLYWNEGMGEGYFTDDAFQSFTATDFPFLIDSLNVSNHIDTIGWCQDLNNNGEFYEFVEVGGGEYPFGMYYGAISSFGSMGIDENDNIYVVYSTVMEGGDYLKSNASPNAQQFRHLYVTRYNGQYWGDPVLISTVDGNAENVYATLANFVDENVHIAVQWDNEPGVRLKETADPITDNYIVYKSVPVSELSVSDVLTYKVTIKTINSTTKADVNDINVIFGYGKKYTGANDNQVEYTNILEGEYDLSAIGYEDKATTFNVTGDCIVIYDLGTGTATISNNEISNIEVNIYPNPVSDYINIHGAKGANIEIYNTLGSLVETISASENITKVNVSNYAIGVYVVKISTLNGVITKTITKTNN
jgi:hypothetical protein